MTITSRGDEVYITWLRLLPRQRPVMGPLATTDCYEPAVLATRCEEPVVIEGAVAVAKSFPDFFEVLKESE